MDNKGYQELVREYAEQLRKRCEEAAMQGKPLKKDKLEKLTSEVGEFLSKHSELTEERARCEARMAVYTELATKSEQPAPSAVKHTEEKTQDGETERLGTVTAGTNETTGETVYQVRLSDRLTSEEWKAVLLRARNNKGYYYKKGGFFAFRTEEDANNFNNIKPYERDSEKSVTGDLGVQSSLPNGAEKETAAGAAETERKERGVEESIIDVNEKIAIEGDYGEEDEQEEESQEESQEQEKQPAEKTSRTKSSSGPKSQKDQSKTTDWRESLAEFVKAANGLRVEVDEKHLSVINADGETVVEHTVNNDEIMRIIMPMSHRESIFASGYSHSLSESSLNVFSHIAENPEDIAKVREALESGMSAEQAHDKGESTVSRIEKTSGGDTTTKHPQPKEKTATAKPQKQQASQMSLDFSMTEEESGKEETKKEEVKPDKKTQDNERDNEKDTGVSSRGGDSGNASESTAPDSDGSGRDREKSEGDRAGISDGGDGGNEHRGPEGGISTDGRDRGEEPLHATDRGAENDDTIRGQGESGRGSGVLQTDAGGENGGEREGQTLGPDERGGEGRADAPDGRKNKQVKKREELPTDLNPNFLTYTDNLPVMGEAGRIEANIAAIKTVYELDMQGRQATPEEQRTMSLYTGFGGINIADGRYSRDYEVRDRIWRLSELIDKIDPDGKNDVYKNLMLSTTTAYYTDIDIAKAINAITEKEGFKGGRWLDPATGSGHFIGTMPESFLHSTEVWGCEPDYITAKIAKYLYPEAHIEMNTLQASDIRNGYFDVVSTNDPFGYTPVEDASWRKAMTAAREVASKSLHGYFAIKKIEAARSGGLVNFITSKGLLDTRSNALVREYIADTCEIIGALRMPNTAFRSSSTRVVADIILLRKFSSDEEKMLFHENEEYRKKIMDPFLTTKEITIKRGEGADDIKVNINSYFEEHPDNILGEIAPGGMYSENEYTVIKADDGLSVAEEIGAQADRILEMRRQMFGETIYTPIGESAVKIADKIEEGEVPYKGLLRENLVTGSLVIQDGKVGVLRLHEDAYGDKTAHFQTNEITAALDIVQTRMFITLRDRLHELMEAQISDEKKDTDTLRKGLHEAYTAYAGKYGRLYDRKSRPMKYDISSSQVFALERTETLAVSRDGSEKTVTKTELTGMAEIYDHDINISKIATTKPETPEEAIMRSLSLYARIDEQYMEDTIGEDWLEKCGDRVYENPNGEYEISEIYLSGDVVTKLEEARRAEKDDEKFGRNVSALEQVQPKKIEFGFFPAHMGARWIPVEIYNEFLQHIFGIKPSKHRGNWKKEVRTNISYYEPLSEYICNFDESEFGGEAYNWTSGSKKCKEIFEAALIDKDIVIYHPTTEPGEKKTVDKEATREANAKVQEMRDAFEDWLPTRPELIEKVEKEYNNRFNRIVLPKWDGSHLETPSLAGMQLRPHQKDAVWMLLNNKGGIVDHMVGAGKTLVMQTAVMEMRRTGIARKPMLLVWKSTIDQVVQSFQEAYPMAKILAPSKNDFSPENRDKFFAQIALNEYDAIIVTHDQFERFNHTKEARLSSYREELAQLEATKLMLGEQREQTQISKKVQGELAKKIKNLQAKIEKAEQKQEDCKYYFEKMGIDCLIVDESHSFKNLRYFTQYSGVAGVGDPDGSNKANNLLIAIRHIQKMNGGDRGVVFLSGTTISNSLTEMYNIFNYLRPEKMRQMGLNTFDAWASTFARRSTEAEFGVTTELKARTRFRRFEAIKELSALYNEISDVRNSKNLTLPRPAEKSHLVTIKPSETVEMLNKEIIKMVKTQNGEFFGLVTNDKSPWGLLASNLGKKLTVSPKLIDEKFDDERGKIFHLTENIKHIYDKFEEQKGVQLVFLDTGISHGDGKWNAYDAIIKSLNEDYGIPKEQIADIHDADSDVKRKALFTRVNNGEVRILIGGTKNMGTGVNVQKRVVAMHHMDIPWTPADVEQRNGRGVRQGNEVARDYNNNEVDIYYYAVEHTIDTYRYQLQDTKGKMIDMFKTSSADMEAGATFEEQDGDEEGMKWATMMSILSGNPLILEKKKCEDKVETLERRKRGFIRDQAKKRQLHKETLEKKEKMEALVRYNGYDKERLERKGFIRDEKGNWPKIKVRLYSNEISAGEYELNTQFGEELQKRVLAFENLELRAYGASAKINILPYKNDGRNVYEMNLEVSSAIKYTHTLQSSAQSWGAAFGVVLHKVINNAEKYVEENARLEQMLKTMPTGEEAFPKEQELLLAKATLEDVTKRYEAMADAEDKEEKKESGLKAFINEVTSGRVSMPIKARETILEYNVKYAMSASDEERSQVIKEAVEKLTGVSVVMYNNNNIYDVAKQNGANEDELKQVKRAQEKMSRKNGHMIMGFVTSENNSIFLNSECGSIRKALAVAIHEWQHLLNRGEEDEREQLAKEIGEETLQKALKVFNDSKHYDQISGGEIIDEIIAHAVYQRFYNNDPIEMLIKAGIDEKLTNTIKEKAYGNRTSYSQYVSRWNAPYDRDNSESIGQDGRDKEPESGIVEKEGFGPAGQGGGGTRNTIDFYVEKALASGGYKATESAEATTYTRLNDTTDGEYVGVIRESVDTRNGDRIFVVEKKRYVTREEFSVLCERAREYGGYYTTFPQNRGFIFRTEEEAENFNHITKEEVVVEEDVKTNQITETDEIPNENRSGIENQPTQNESENAQRGTGRENEADGRTEGDAGEKQIDVPSYTEQEEEWNYRLDLLQAQLRESGYEQQKRKLAINDEGARLLLTFRNEKGHELKIYSSKTDKRTNSEFELNISENEGKSIGADSIFNSEPLTNSRIQSYLEELGILTNIGSINEPLLLVDDLVNISKREAEKEEKDFETANTLTEETTELIEGATDTHKIQDYGEHIRGARKDEWSTIAKELEDIKQQSLLDNPLSKVFKKPNLQQLKEDGMSDEDIIMVRALTDNIERVPKPAKTKSRWDTRRQDWAKETFNKISKLRDYIVASEKDREETRNYYHSIEAQGMRRFDDEDYIAFDLALLENLNFTAEDKMDNFLRGLTIEKWSGMYVSRNSKIIAPSTITDDKELLQIVAESYRLSRGDVEGTEVNEKLIGVTPNETARRESETHKRLLYGKNFLKASQLHTEDVPKEKLNERIAELENRGMICSVHPLYETYNKNYVIFYRNILTGEITDLTEKLFETVKEARDYISSGEAAELIRQRAAEEAHKNSVNEKPSKESAVKIPEINVYRYRYKVEADGTLSSLNGNFAIAIAIPAKQSPTGKDYIFGYFDTGKEAYKYLNEHLSELQDEIRNVIESNKQNRVKVFFQPNMPRKGEDYRKGENITPEKLAETFGFRGVQFGNWANDQDRQQALNETYDALKDLAREIGFEEKMLSLNGELGIAFGARGGGNASAHYEPGEVVINLTKTKGAGSLAHEWMHAIDNYFSRREGDKIGMITDKNLRGIRNGGNIEKYVAAINRKMSNSNYSIRCSGYGDYWNRPHEKWARLFAEWVHHRIEERGESSHYLSRGIDQQLFENTRKNSYQLYIKHCQNIKEEPLTYEQFKERHMGETMGIPYPTKEESMEYTEMFKELFRVMGETIKYDEHMKEQKELMVQGEREEASLLVGAGLSVNRDIYDLITDQLERCNLEVRYERMEDKAVKGYAQDYTITLNTNTEISLETPLHEYTHIWCAAMERENPEEWERIKAMLKGTIYYKDVLTDSRYADIAGDDDRVASETLARISGRQGAKRMIEIEKKYAQETGLPYGLPLKGMRDKALGALKSLWNWTAEHLLTGRQRPRNVEEVADLVLNDLLSGRDLRSKDIAKSDEEYKKLDSRLAKTTSESERKEILDEMQRIVNQEASDTLKDAVTREKSGQLSMFILSRSDLEKLHSKGALRLTSLNKEDTAKMQSLRNNEVAGTGLTLEDAGLNPVLEEIAKEGFMTVFANLKRPVRFEERQILGKNEKMLRQMAKEKDPDADGIIYLNELDKRETIVFSEDSLYAADVLTQDEKDGKHLSERFSSREGEKEYFIVGQKGAAALDELDEMHRIDDLRTAMQYNRAGISAKDIKNGFFWEKGIDGKWMYEVPLTDFTKIEERIKNETGEDGIFSGSFTLDDLPELRRLYPNEELEIEINISPAEERDRGLYYVKTEDTPGKIILNLRNTRYLKKGIVHEAQHFAQDIEGLPLGTSTKEIERAKQTVIQLLQIDESRINDIRLIKDRMNEAGAESLDKAERTAMAYGCDIPHLLQTPTEILYMTNYGELMAKISANRTLDRNYDTEEDYSYSLINSELMFGADELWIGQKPNSMQWKVNGEGYVYNDNGQPLKENEYREYQKQLKEELTAAADGDRIRFYVPLSEKEVNEMVKYGYSLPNRTQNAITTTRQIARPGVPLVVTVDIPTDNVDSIRRNATQDGYILPLLKRNSYRIASIRQSNEPKMFSYGGILFCRQDGATNKTRKAREEQVRIMAKAIEKIFPEEMRNRTRILTHEEYERLGNDMSDYIPSSIAVAEKDGMVYIDAERARVDTPLHELGVHRLMDIARRYSLSDIEKAILRYGETAPEPIKREVRRVYPDIEEKSDLYKEECAAMALGLQQQYRIEQFLQKEEYKGWYVRLTNYISGTLNKIKSVFLGKQYADLTPLQCLEGLGHEVIGNRLFSLIMSGREIKVDNRKKLQYIGETRAQVIGENGIKNLAASGKYSEQAVIRYGETIGSTYAKYLAIEGTENARDPKLLRLATDMFRSSIDRKLRMEIVSPSFVPDEVLQEKLDGRTTLHLKDVLTEDNAILTAYPQLREAEVVGAVRNNINNDFANIQKEYEEVYDETAVGEIRYRISVFKQTLKEWKQSLIHELQHAIQTIEGFEEGYPFTTPLKTKEIEFLRKHTASMTATQLKHLSQSVSNEYLEQYGIRRKAIPTIRELLSLGKTKLEREIKEIDEGLRRYTANAGENEAYAASARMDLTKEQRLERPFSMDYFVDETRQEPSPINEFLRKTGQTIEYNLFNMKDNMLSFAEQRARVSIIELAQHYGYRVIPKQGMRCPILEHPSGDKIGILNPTNSASQGFWTIGDDTNKGVLYNFVASRVAMGIIPNTLPSPESNNPNFVVNKVVHDYLNIPTEIRQRNQDLQKRIESRLENAETPKDYMQYCKTCENTEFLSRRGMGAKAIESPLFKDRMFNLDQEKLAKDNLITKAGDNDTIGFPLWNSKGEMIGLERRCDDVKMFVQGSQKGVGVWHSNIPDRITDAVICETPLDAMAYHELQGNDNTIYFATAGNVCVEQINQINEILRANNDRVDAKEFQFHLANDNDRAGASFNLQYVKSQMRLKRDCATDNLPTENGYTQTLISYKTAEQRNEVLERLKKVLAEKEPELTNDKGELIVRLSEKNEQMKESILIQSKSGDMYATQTLCDALISATRLNRTKIEKAVTKDYNDDLKLLNLVHEREQGAKFSYGEIKLNKSLFEPEIKQIMEKKKPTAAQIRREKISQYLERHKGGGIKM
jgi:N12 class adenine-specific DNA methylase